MDVARWWLSSLTGSDRKAVARSFWLCSQRCGAEQAPTTSGSCVIEQTGFHKKRRQAAALETFSRLGGTSARSARAGWQLSARSLVPLMLLVALLCVAAVTTEASADNALGLSVTPPARREVITGSLTCAIAVTNRSTSAAENVRVTVELPPSIQFLRATNQYPVTPSIAIGESNVVFAYPRINAGDVARMRVSVLPMAVGPVTNAVSVSAPGVPETISAQSVFTVRSIQVSIHDPAMAKEGDTCYL